eukprot:1362265-Rhodomonas_salina.1
MQALAGADSLLPDALLLCLLPAHLQQMPARAAVQGHLGLEFLPEGARAAEDHAPCVSDLAHLSRQLHRLPARVRAVVGQRDACTHPLRRRGKLHLALTSPPSPAPPQRSPLPPRAPPPHPPQGAKSQRRFDARSRSPRALLSPPPSSTRASPWSGCEHGLRSERG